MFEIWQKGKDCKGLLKKYPYKAQCYIWLLMNGYINTGRRMYFINPSIEIKECGIDG